MEDDPCEFIADLLSFALLPKEGWDSARSPYGHERKALDYLANRKSAGNRPPINAWTAWIVEEGYPPEKAGPALHGIYWKPPV